MGSPTLLSPCYFTTSNKRTQQRPGRSSRDSPDHERQLVRQAAFDASITTEASRLAKTGTANLTLALIPNRTPIKVAYVKTEMTNNSPEALLPPRMTATNSNGIAIQ